jgi:hypothetical protein
MRSGLVMGLDFSEAICRGAGEGSQAAVGQFLSDAKSGLFRQESRLRAVDKSNAQPRDA